jgi:acetyl esterase/lipase
MFTGSWQWLVPTIVVLALLGGADSVVGAAPLTWDDVKNAKPDTTVTYQTHNEHKLTLSVFTPPDFAATQRRPALVIIHGGSWVSGEPQLFFPHARYFAMRGLVVFDVAYRLATPKGSTLFDCVLDVQSALRYIRAHAKQLGVDPQRIAVAGDSAGGHLAACLGVTMPAQATGQDPRTWEKANVVILYNPEVDLTTLNWAKGTPGIPQRIVNGPGANLSPEEKLRVLSPIFHVTEGQPPCLIIHGTKDDCVPIEQCIRYETVMKQASNSCRVIKLEGVSHAFILPEYGSEALALRALRETDLFLVAQGYLRGKPLIDAPVK